MVHGAVPSEDAPNPDPEQRLNVDPDQVHLVVTTLELDIIVDALRSVGNVELAERFETILHQIGRTGSGDLDG